MQESFRGFFSSTLCSALCEVNQGFIISFSTSFFFFFLEGLYAKKFSKTSTCHVLTFITRPRGFVYLFIFLSLNLWLILDIPYVLNVKLVNTPTDPPTHVNLTFRPTYSTGAKN